LKGRAVARRYAKALIDLAGRDDRLEEIGAQLRQHRDVLSTNAALQRVLYNPSVSIEVKTGILAQILARTQPAPLLRSFLLLLVEKDRLRQFDLICEHYEYMANEWLRRVVARVTTAVELDTAQRQAVMQKLRHMTQKDVILETQVDPAILGGLVVRIDHVILDGSLQGQLTRLRQELIRG
jgi:F-type H+-transporting ATPase subunit delta